MDSIQYMGNAVLMETSDPVIVHQRVYAALRRGVPPAALRDLLGNEPGAPSDQNESRRQRASDPRLFAEFLPLFAIRPLYNQTLYLFSRSGIGLVRSGVLISVLSYFGLGVLLFEWVRPYTTPTLSFLLPLLCMLTPPLTALGRDTTSDALATLIAMGSLYLIFEKRLLAIGVVFLLLSIFFRTDFVALAGPVILILWVQDRLPLWQGAVLSVVAVSSVLCINHFAGDYGIGMLYYRNFVGTPVAPAEMSVHLSVHGYLAAFRSGITKASESFFFPFVLLGVSGARSKFGLPVLVATLLYVVLHFLILPNWQERWFGVFYLSAVICAADTLNEAVRARLPERRTVPSPV